MVWASGHKATLAALAVLAAAVGASLVGWALFGPVGELSSRTERAIATFNDGALAYTTRAGEAVSIVPEDDCKLRSASPPRRCRAYFENGDEVMVTFDSANPTRTWSGPTPGGVLATSLFWGGIAVGIFALFFLWFTSPLYRRISRPHIPGEQPRSFED